MNNYEKFRADSEAAAKNNSNEACPNCHAKLREDAVFCGNCGSVVPRCPTCGRVLTQRTPFCPYDRTAIPRDILELIPVDNDPEPAAYEENASDDGSYGNQKKSSSILFPVLIIISAVAVFLIFAGIFTFAVMSSRARSNSSEIAAEDEIDLSELGSLKKASSETEAYEEETEYDFSDKAYSREQAEERVTIIEYITEATTERVTEAPNYSVPGESAPFYGVWCGAFKDVSNAQKAANDLISKGYNAKIYISSDWSNLNSDTWYVVTAGVYESKEAADSVLPAVEAAGYSSAYVKYSGYYKYN